MIKQSMKKRSQRDLIKIFTKEDFIPDIEDNYMKKKRAAD